MRYVPERGSNALIALYVYYLVTLGVHGQLWSDFENFSLKMLDKA
jgi:hypothetical protein